MSRNRHGLAGPGIFVLPRQANGAGVFSRGPFFYPLLILVTNGAGPNSAKRPGSPVRLCAGLFSAAELLELSFVHGAPRHLYVEEPSPELFQLLGLVRAREGESVDVFVRVPMASASIFRAAVNVSGVPASDVLQIWLDVASHPVRGGAQADEIWRRVLAPSLGVK
jgi:hypothetical protein